MLPKLSVLVRTAFVAASLFFAGCATLPPASSDVAVTLSDIRAGEAGAFESRLAIVVRLTNRDPDEHAFTGSRHEVSINGRVIGTAVSDADLALPGLSTATKEVEMNLSHFALISLVRELQRNPSAIYKIESTLFGTGPFARPLRTIETGAIDLRTLAATPAP